MAVVGSRVAHAVEQEIGGDRTDLLLGPDPLTLTAPRHPGRNTHGTGCTLSSAIAAFLALGKNLPQAVQLARAYVRAALQAGAEVQTGHGYGPVNHGFAPQAMQLVPRA